MVECEDDEENGEPMCWTAAERPIGSLEASFLPHLICGVLNHAAASHDHDAVGAADADADADADEEDADD